MRLAGIQFGDIVEVDRLGRRFHALVTGEAPGGLAVQPLDKRVTYRSCRAHEVRTHWSKRGRPRGLDEPRVTDERRATHEERVTDERRATDDERVTDEQRMTDEPLEPSLRQLELDTTGRD